MSDPFSIASGAVGVISLGIQLCKHITEYAEGWRGYDEDIESIGLKAESLKGPLKQLRDLVEDTRLTDSETANNISNKVLELERCLKRLENRLAQAKPVISDSLKERLRNKLKKVAYPVRAQNALRDIKADLESIQATIQFALTIFNAQRTQRTYDFQEKTFKLVEEIHLTISTIPQNSMPAPALLKSLSDRCNECDKLGTSNSLFNSTMTEFPKHTRRVTPAKTLFQYYSGWLRRQITLSFSLSNGAGAFSIAPILEVQVYRGEDCWAEITLSKHARILHQGRYPGLKHNYEDELIREFQQAMSAGKFGPRDVTKSGDSVVNALFRISTIGFFYVHRPHRGRGFELSRFLRVMIDCGFKADSVTCEVLLNLFMVKWTEDIYLHVMHLLNHGARVKFLPGCRHMKENIRRVLCMDDDFVEVPEVVKIILRESEPDLRKVLKSGVSNANDKIESRSLLDFAVGWPEGIRILLEFGADASKLDLARCSFQPSETKDSDFDKYIDSIKPLLYGGCILTSESITKCKSENIRSFLIDEYVKQLRYLQSVAQSYLPPEAFDSIPSLENPESILDVHVSRVCKELVKYGWPADYSIGRSFGESYIPVYHQDLSDLDPWDDLYRTGFRDIDEPDSCGFTPLMICGLCHTFNARAIAWLVDKGATLSRRLPSSKTTIAHLLSSKMAAIFGDAIFYKGIYFPGYLHTLIQRINKRKDTIFLIPSVKDFCVCACCEGGCTTLLVALRKCNAIMDQAISSFLLSSLGKTPYSLLLTSLIDLTEATRERDYSIIRIFTFEALGLRHTCCCELTGSLGRDYTNLILEEEEIQNIQDEDQLRYRQFEQLLRKLNTLFNDLEMPIMDFLNDPWHKYMAQVLSTRDPYNKMHMLETRKLGVFLKPVESYEVRRFFSLLGNQVEELNCEDDFFDDDDKGDELTPKILA